MNLRDYSVVIPAYNAGAFIQNAIGSVLAQTNPPVAVFLVDDGSSDDTVAQASALGPKVTVVSQENRGPGAATTVGLSLVRTPLVAMLDADDLWLPDKIERQMKCMNERRAVAVFGRLADFSGKPDPQAMGEPYDGWVRTTLLMETAAGLENGPIIDPVGRVGEMIDWIDRLRSSGAPLAMLDEVVAYRRIHANNTTRRDRQELARAFLEVAKRSLDRKRAAQRTNDH